MDIKRIIPTVCLVAVFVYGGIKLRHGFIKLMNIDVTQSEDMVRSASVALDSDGFAQYLRAPKTFEGELATSGLPKECESYVSGLENLNFLFYKTDNFKITYQQLTEPSSACSITDEAVAETEKNYLQNCFLSNPTKTDVLGEVCVKSIFGLRATLTRFLLKDKNIKDIHSQNELTDLLYAEILKNPDLQRVLDITDQMLDLKPNFKAAKSVNFRLAAEETMRLAAGKSEHEQDALWEHLQSDFEKAREANLFENNLTQYQAVIETRGFEPNLTLQYAARILSANPANAWGVFLSAYGHWKEEDQEAAFKELKKAMELDPKNEDYRQVFMLLTQSGAGTESFNPALKLGINLQDFDK
jgi:hypothetical protein